MKSILILVAVATVVFGSTTAHARCMSGSSWSFPSASDPVEKTIPQNASVVVFSQGTEQPELEKSVKRNRTYFVSGKHKVKAVFGELRVSEYTQTAVTVTASKPLKKDRTYRLKLAGKTHKWKVVEADSVKPTWTSSPVMTAFNRVEFGCGPAVNFKVQVGVTDTSLLYYDVELQTSKGAQRFYTTPYESGLSIGHGMCSGEFVVSEKGENLAILTPVDAAGNRGESRTIKLTATK